MIKFILLFLFSFPVYANTCFIDAGEKYELSPVLLAAIAQHESRMNPNLIHMNSNGSLDIGMMGINSVHLRPEGELGKLGITMTHLKNECFNVLAGAYLLSLKVAKYGNVWRAVGAYHSETPYFGAIYISKIQNKTRNLFDKLNQSTYLASVE